ncbi:MAG TPA: ABC transporter substrate-binding protein [Anaerolineales bacterium]|nr:ABC transporter substrate-binding protein [Anaerolineales bacterium]
MKTHMKWITFVILAFFVAVMAGCTPEAPATEDTAPTEERAEPTEEMAEPTEVRAEPTEEMAEPTQEIVEEKEPVTLRYANWNLGTEEENNIQRQLIQAYIDANPHVTIEFVDMSAEGGWDAVLTSYAAQGALPDVFMANNVPLYVQNGWLADLTDMTAADPDWANIPQLLRDSVTYNGQVLGVPAAQFIMGYFVNLDIYEAANLDAPEYGVSADEFFETAVTLTDVSQGVLGLDEMEFIMGWYANTQDSSLNWFSFDGTHMNYNSQAFKDAVAKAGEMRPYTWQGLTDEQKANFSSVGPWELFLNQEVGVRWDGGWSVPNYVQNATFEWDFIGIPGGTQAMVADVIVVSATTANLEEAYNFARWMSFSTEAYAKEAELAAAMDSAPKMPVSVNDASLALYTGFFDKPGLLAALNNLDVSLLESLAKVVPGYINARWEGKPGIDISEDLDVNLGYMFSNASAGTFKFEDYSAQLEEFANQILDDATAALEQ